MSTMVSREVTIRYRGGETKKVILGVEATCVSAQPRGWGTECKTLVLKKDGLYHCGDCGLVFKKPVQKTKSRVTLVACDCSKLVNFLVWFYDECHGCDCPSCYYQCLKCSRVYNSPHYSREASIQLQESEVAKKHVQNHLNFKKQERTERIDRARENAKELKEILKQIPRTVRQKVLRELTE